VPVIGYKTGQFPAFFTQDSGEKAHLRRDTPQDIARLIHESEALGLPNGHIIAVPNPKPVPAELINEAIEVLNALLLWGYKSPTNCAPCFGQLGLQEVVEKNIHGQAVTPYLLKRVNEITKGVSLESNIDLVNNNATVGSQVWRSAWQHASVFGYAHDAATGFGSTLQIACALFDLENGSVVDPTATKSGVHYSLPTEKVCCSRLNRCYHSPV